MNVTPPTSSSLTGQAPIPAQTQSNELLNRVQAGAKRAFEFFNDHLIVYASVTVVTMVSALTSHYVIAISIFAAGILYAGSNFYNKWTIEKVKTDFETSQSLLSQYKSGLEETKQQVQKEYNEHPERREESFKANSDALIAMIEAVIAELKPYGYSLFEIQDNLSYANSIKNTGTEEIKKASRREFKEASIKGLYRELLNHFDTCIKSVETTEEEWQQYYQKLTGESQK